jgi:Spy/CpxP family protein refolding chaperone
MFLSFRPLLVTALLSAASVGSAAAQQAPQPTESKEAAYTRTITERAAKIVATLGLTDEAKGTKVRDVIADQYRALNEVHEARKTQLTALKAQPKDDKTEAATKKIEDQTTAALDRLHGKYLKQLGRYLTADQVALVKDGMTYRVLPITMTAYEDMLPNLTAEQKAQLLTWLTEAREHAMDASTSEEKHKWFGKYKGRINNYLSAAGIDMNQAGKDWQARLAARKAAAAPATN